MPFHVVMTRDAEATQRLHRGARGLARHAAAEQQDGTLRGRESRRKFCADAGRRRRTSVSCAGVWPAGGPDGGRSGILERPGLHRRALRVEAELEEDRAGPALAAEPDEPFDLRARRGRLDADGRLQTGAAIATPSISWMPRWRRSAAGEVGRP